MSPADSSNLKAQQRDHPADSRFGEHAPQSNGQSKRPVPVEEEFVDEEDPFDGWDDEEEGRVLEGGSFELREPEAPAPKPAPPIPEKQRPAAQRGSRKSSSKGERRRSKRDEQRAPSKVAEQRAPRRVGDEFGNFDAERDTDLDEATPEEIQRETERWAPKTVLDTVADPGIEKICRVCGKNLKGHRRYKDERGYICVSCDRDERARRIPCAECGKPVPPEALRPWGPIAICARCWADHESDPKLRIKRKVSSRPWEELEKKTVLAIAAVVGVVLLILLLVSWI